MRSSRAPRRADVLLYRISPRDMRKNRADAVKVMLECAAMATLGVRVKLITPHVRRPEYPVSKSALWQQYGLTPNFDIVELPTWYRDAAMSRLPFRDVFARAQRIAFLSCYALALGFRSALDRRERVFMIPRPGAGIAFVLVRNLLRTRWRIYHLAGAFAEGNRIDRFMARNADGVIAINEHIRDGFRDAYGVEDNRLAAPEPYSYLELFESCWRGREIPRPDELPAHEKVVLYVGKISYPPHGEIDLLLDCARLLPQYRFAFVGGNGESERAYQELAHTRGARNAIFLGFRALPDLYPIACRSDVLVSYYSRTDPLAATDRVPAKFSLYLSAGKPIVAADFPGMRAVLREGEAVFVPPDTPEALAEAIEAILTDPGRAAELGERALERARRSSIAAFCEELLDYMGAGENGADV